MREEKEGRKYILKKGEKICMLQGGENISSSEKYMYMCMVVIINSFTFEWFNGVYFCDKIDTWCVCVSCVRPPLLISHLALSSLINYPFAYLFKYFF
jgi:hypothetical protein